MKFKMKALEDFKWVRKIRAANLIVQIILAVVLFFGVNYLASRHYVRKDFSPDKSNSLSPESVAHIRDLKNPVKIYTTFSVPTEKLDHTEAAEFRAMIDEIERLISRYEYESGTGASRKISYQKIDPILDRRGGEKLVEQFGAEIDNAVIIACGDKNKKLAIADLYDFEGDNRKVFKGEQAISSAILSVSNPKENKIYFVRGHGELNYKSIDANTGFSEFANALLLRGYKLSDLDLSAKAEIPSDADMLIIAAPQTSFLPKELDSLRKYLSHSNGRLIIFLGMGPIVGLDDLMFDWGLRSDDMKVVDASDYESTTGDLIAKKYPSSPHSIVKFSSNFGLRVQFGSIRPVREDMGAAIDGNLKLSPLIFSGETSWADKAYRTGRYAYDKEADLAGPLPLAMVASRSTPSDYGLEIRGGRMVVFGDENFAMNGRFNSLGNSKLILNTINWMFDENSALNIPPRKVDRYSLTLSRSDLFNLGARFLILPILILAAGFITYIFRRQ